MTKRIANAERTNNLLIYCVERDRPAIANASLLLAAFLLIVAGKTPAQAAEPFTGPSAPYFLAPFRDASFRRQVLPPRPPPLANPPAMPRTSDPRALSSPVAARSRTDCADARAQERFG